MSSRTQHKRVLLYVLSVLMLIGAVGVTGLHAQLASNATLLGTVTDASGAAIAGAMITVKNSGTGVTYMTVSDSQGRYSVQDLIIGTYEVDVEAAGFQRYVHGGITLTVGSQIVVDAPMQVGTVQQTVTVESDVSHVETTSTAVTNLVEEKQLADLPLNGRNYYDLVQLSPGVIFTSSGSLFYGNQNNFSVSGGRPSGQAYLVDDTNTANFWNHSTGSGTLGTQLGVDSVAEFQTMLNTYGAQFGGAGAAFNASTKSGTNNFHGTVYEFLLNSATSASNTFVPTTSPTPKPYQNNNQFGFSLGGPIKKNKAFFFVNYEGLRTVNKSFSQLSEPDPLARGCVTAGGAPSNNPKDCPASGVGPGTPQIFSATTNSYVSVPYAPCNGNNTALFPNTLYPLGNGCAERASIKGILSLLPIGNPALGDTPTSGMALTDNIANPTYGRENYVTGRFDYTISDKDTFFAKVTSDTSRQISVGSLGLLPQTAFSNDIITTVEERRIFSPTLLNNFHISYVRPNDNASQYGEPIVKPSTYGESDFANCFGCTIDSPLWYFPDNHSSNIAPCSPAAMQFCQGNAAGVEGREAGENFLGGLNATSTVPFYLIPNNFTIGDDIIWTKGAHSLKFGFSVERMVENTWAPFVTASGWSTSGCAPGTIGASGNVNVVVKNGVATPDLASNGITTALACAITGQFTATSQGELSDFQLRNAGLPPQDGTLDVRETLFAPYFQDDWKISSRITLNLGIRYSPTLNPTMVRHLNENLLNAPWAGAAFGSLTTSAPSGGNGVYPTGTNCAAPTATSGSGLPLACGWVPITHPFVQNVSLKNWDPRIGVAWDPFKDHKTSVRAGVGIFHTIVVARDYDMWIQPPAIIGTESFNYPTAGTPTATSQVAGSPNIFPFIYASVSPCASTAYGPGQPGGGTIINQPAGYTGAVSQYTNCLSPSSGGATYYDWHGSPYQIQYNVNVQREVLPQTIVSVGFVGSRGVDLVGQHDFNAFTPCGGVDNSGGPNNGSPIYTEGYSTQLKTYIPCQRLNPDLAGVAMLNAQYDSWYNSMQVSINRRFSKGLQMQTSYTWSRTIDIVDGSYGLDGGGTVTDPWNFQVNKGVASNSRTHNFRVSTIYTLPFRKNQLVAGWQFSAIYSVLSGSPFTVSGLSRGGYGQSVNWAPNNPGCNGNPYTGVSPDAAVNRYVGTITNAQAGSPFSGPATSSVSGAATTPYLNPNCFSVVPVGEIGNMAKNTFQGPASWNLDASLIKDTKITKISEQFDIQFRAEFFNVLNHPTWGSPTASLWSLCTSASCGTVGGITTAGTAQGPNNSSTSFGQFGNPSSTPRRMQFAIKFIF